VWTATFEVMLTGWGSSWSRSQARPTSIRPLPWSAALYPGMKRAVELKAIRSWAAVWLVPVALAALSSSAAAPVACGAAIDVPLNIP
jgi:hypothetical protein